MTETFLRALDADSERRLFTPGVFAALVEHDWPGNVRELRNYVERAIVLDTVAPATSADRPSTEGEAEPPRQVGPIDLGVPFKQAKERLITGFEREYLAALLAWSGGNVSRAARRARMDRMNLHRLVQLYGIPAGRAIRD